MGIQDKLPKHWVGIRKGYEHMGLPLGEVLVSVPPSDLKTHCLVVGATGSGKTTLLHHLLAQDILRRHSFVLLDMRGDLVSSCIELCASRVAPQNIALFDLREKERPLGFGPLHGSGESYFRALGVLDLVASESESWGVQIAETMRMAVMLLAEARAPLTDIENIFHNSRIRQNLIAQCRNVSVSAFWQRFELLTPDRQSGLASPVLNKVSILFATDSLRRMLGNPRPFDLGRHLNQPGSVTLVSLAVDEVHAAGRMVGNLMLASICREVFSRVSKGETDRNPVRIYVDEFENFGTKQFETILAEGRRFGLSVVLAHQTLVQLTPRIRSMILNNVGVKFVFRTGRDDSGTLSKDLTGDAKALDLSLLNVGDCIVSRRSEPPFLMEVNAPLFTSVGLQSSAGKQLLADLRARNPSWTPSQPPQPPQPKSPRLEPLPIVGGVEDWL